MTDTQLRNKIFARISDQQLQMFESACHSAGMNYSEAIRYAVSTFILKIQKRNHSTRGDYHARRNNDFY